MKNLKPIFLLFISLWQSNYIFSQSDPEIISTCVNSVSGVKHGHILSILDCNETIEITSTTEEPTTIISGVVVSNMPILITPGENGARIIPTNHSENDPLIQDRTHTATHIKVKPPTGGRFMEFKKKQIKLIFPNPAKDKITINTKEKLTSIIIYNLYGTMLIKKDLQNSSKEKNTIDITQLDKGFYTIKILFGNGTTKTETLIKN